MSSDVVAYPTNVTLRFSAYTARGAQKEAAQESGGAHHQVNLLARLPAQLLFRHVGRYGVAPGQFAQLRALHDEDGQTPAELAVGVEPGTMTKTLQRMEPDALIERRPDPTDGRRVRIHLSDRARQLEPTLKVIVVDLNAKVLEGLSPHQRGCFMGYVAVRVPGQPEAFEPDARIPQPQAWMSTDRGRLPGDRLTPFRVHVLPVAGRVAGASTT